MSSIARFVIFLALAIWIGGIVFFSFVAAPSVFATISNHALAGSIIGRCLRALHFIGLICGVCALAATFVVDLNRSKALRVLLVLMISCTAISQFGITPQIQRLRDTVGASIEVLPPQDAGRAAFDRLHQFSVGLEGIVLLAGTGTLAVLSREEPAS